MTRRKEEDKKKEIDDKRREVEQEVSKRTGAEEGKGTSKQFC
jgi:hypothetical protein